MGKTIKRFLMLLAILVVLGVLIVAPFTVPTTSMSPTVESGDFVLVNKFRYGITSQNIVPILGYYLPYAKLVSFGLPGRDVVVVYTFPGDRDEVTPSRAQPYMKRCIAIAGDTLRIVNDTVFVNGKRSQSDLLAIHRMSTGFMKMSNEHLRYRTFPKGMNWTVSNYGPLRIPKHGDTLTLDAQGWRGWSVFIGREGHEVDEQARSIDGVAAKHYVVERDYIFCLGDNRHNSADCRFTGVVAEENVFGSPICALWSTEEGNGRHSTGEDSLRSGKRPYPRLIR